MIYYEDLLTTPYKEGGRNYKEGLDCYGLVLELEKRAGNELQDFPLYSPYISPQDLKQKESILKAKQIDRNEIKEADIFEFFENERLHLGVVLSKDTLIHMTYSGARISHTDFYRNAIFFRIEK